MTGKNCIHWCTKTPTRQLVTSTFFLCPQVAQSFSRKGDCGCWNFSQDVVIFSNSRNIPDCRQDHGWILNMIMSKKTIVRQECKERNQVSRSILRRLMLVELAQVQDRRRPPWANSYLKDHWRERYSACSDQSKFTYFYMFFYRLSKVRMSAGGDNIRIRQTKWLPLCNSARSFTRSSLFFRFLPWTVIIW